MFKIIVWPTENMVESRLSGSLSIDGVARYDAELHTHFDARRLHPGYDMLLDVSDLTIQPQDIVIAFQRHIASCPRAGKIAVVTGQSIIRMQVRRVMTQPYMRVFTERADAFAWLKGALDETRAVIDATG